MSLLQNFAPQKMVFFKCILVKYRWKLDLEVLYLRAPWELEAQLLQKCCTHDYPRTWRHELLTLTERWDIIIFVPFAKWIKYKKQLFWHYIHASNEFKITLPPSPGGARSQSPQDLWYSWVWAFLKVWASNSHGARRNRRFCVNF